MKFSALLLCLVSFLFLSSAAFAVQPDEMLQDASLEQRARDISRNIRCLVCQGEAIDESNAELAGDLRQLIRQRLVAGDTDEQVFSYLQARYGDYILMNPPLKIETVFLWFLPPFVLLTGAAIAWFYFLRRKAGA